MFDAIAPRYDLLNHLLSAGIDRRWRAAAIRSLQLTGRETLLDVCCGTADVSLAARHPRSLSVEARSAKAEGRPAAARVVGVDFSGAMLALGVQKVRAAGESSRITLVRGDAMRLPVADRSVDAVTVAFGIRNVQRPGTACGEMARALRPGGRLAIADILTVRQLTDGIVGNADLWASCIGGAAQQDTYREAIENTGLRIEQTRTNPYEFISEQARNASATYGVHSVSLLAVKPVR